MSLIRSGAYLSQFLMDFYNLFRMVPSFSLRPDLPSSNQMGNQSFNLDWINSHTWCLSQNIYVITNLLITNNYIFGLIRKTIFTIFSEHQSKQRGSNQELKQSNHNLPKFMISISLFGKF